MPAWMPPQKKESSIPIDEVTNSWSNMLHDQVWYFLQTILFSLQDLLALLRNSQFTRRVYTTGNQSIEVQVSLIIRKLSVPNNMHLNMSLLYLFTLVCFHSFIHSFIPVGMRIGKISCYPISWRCNEGDMMSRKSRGRFVPIHRSNTVIHSATFCTGGWSIC